MKISIYQITKLTNELELAMMGGENETIFCLDLDDEGIKVKKGHLNIHASIYDCDRFTTMEKTEKLHIMRIYKKHCNHWILKKENIEVNDGVVFQESFVPVFC